MEGEDRQDGVGQGVVGEAAIGAELDSHCAPDGPATVVMTPSVPIRRIA
jgi:hypothetical protein